MHNTQGAVSLVRSLAPQPDGALICQQLIHWLSQPHQHLSAAQRLEKLSDALRQNPAHASAIASQLLQWLGGLQLYPALVSLGIYSRRGFMREMTARAYDKLNPAPRLQQDFKDVLEQQLSASDCSDWLAAGGANELLSLFQQLLQLAPTEQQQQFNAYCRDEAWYALEMLGIWVAAEEIEPELMRLDRRLISTDSPFIALHREISLFIASRKPALADEHAVVAAYDLGHFAVMLSQCYQQLERLRRRGAGVGSTVSVAHLLERLEQTLDRINLLARILNTEPDQASLSRTLITQLLCDAAAKTSVLSLWRSASQMLSKSITINTSGHGEHYIAHDNSQFLRLFRSACGAGVIIALLALNKMHLESLAYPPFLHALLVSLNYGLGFMLVHILHFTIATKQPAMTAASFAAEVEKGENGRAVHKKLAALLIAVNRSQWGAVWGNVSCAVLLACLIAASVEFWRAEPLLSASQVDYQLNAISPLHGALFFAAIAGVWLFCAGIIAGFFDNRANYLELRVRLYQHPLLRSLLPDGARRRLADYLHDNYGALAGNFCFGLLLGMTGYLGYLTGLPLDIRHVAFASANLGYSSVSADLTPLQFAGQLLLVLLIGFVNLWVSFTLALTVALRARGTSISKLPTLLASVWEQARQQPLQLFFPLVRGKKPD